MAHMVIVSKPGDVPVQLGDIYASSAALFAALNDVNSPLRKMVDELSSVKQPAVPNGLPATFSFGFIVNP